MNETELPWREEWNEIPSVGNSVKVSYGSSTVLGITNPFMNEGSQSLVSDTWHSESVDGGDFDGMRSLFAPRNRYICLKSVLHVRQTTEECVAVR